MVQVQQSEHGQAANGADGRKQPNQGTHRHGEIAHGRILREGLNCFRPRHGQLVVCCHSHAFTRANRFIKSTHLTHSSNQRVDALGPLTHMAGAIDRVVLLTGEFFEHNRRKARFKHGLQGFFEIWVPATSADLAMAHGPVPSAL